MTTESDRELLEAAARAAGLKIDKSPYNGGGHGNTGFDMTGDAMLDWHNNKRWNPLRDDGDALRLAVKLDLLNSPRVAHEIAVERFTKNADKLTATRRAIVRAAAAIARATHKEQT